MRVGFSCTSDEEQQELVGHSHLGTHRIQSRWYESLELTVTDTTFSNLNWIAQTERKANGVLCVRVGLGRTKRAEPRGWRDSERLFVCGPDRGEGPDDSFENRLGSPGLDSSFKHPVPTNKPGQQRSGNKEQPSSQTVRGTVRRGIRCIVFVWYSVSRRIHFGPKCTVA
jgi:hypothetical protein